MSSKMAFGLVFGVQLGQNSALYRNLQLIGMSNLWSASGLSISLFLSAQRYFFGLIRYLSLNKKTVLHLFSLLTFWCLSGKSLSLLRAVVMSLLAILVRQWGGRQLSSITALIFTLVIILLLDINHFHSLSLRFSAAAIFAVIYLCPSLEEFCFSLLPFRVVRFSDSHLKRAKLHSRLFFGLKRLLAMLIKNFSLFLSIQLGMLPLASSIWPEIGLLSLAVNTFLAGIAPVLFLVGLIWISLLSFLGIVSLLLNFQLFMATFLSLAIFPLVIFIEMSDHIVQIEQIVIKIPGFSWQATLIWYIGIFLLGEWRQWRVGRALRARPSFTNLINLLTHSPQENA